MTLKEFFISALEQFEAGVTRRADSIYPYHTLGMCDALCDASIVNRIGYDDFPYTDARIKLEEYMPPDAGAYWFPIRKNDATQDECVLPRRAILQAIIDSLPE